MVRSILTAAVILLFSASSFAIGGNRKGFTLGFAGGFAPVVTYDRSYSGGGPSAGPATSLLAGYGIDDKNILVLEGLTAFPMKTNSYVMNFTGVRWYAFTRRSYPSSFLALGMGWSSLTSRSDAAVFNYLVGGKVYLPAATLGFGWEIRERVLVGLYASGGRYQSIGLVNFSILITVLGY
jgi:hypothetical protein